MTKIKNTTDLYLQGFAEPEIQMLDTFPAAQIYAHVLVIPVYNETSDFIVRLTQLPSTQTLFIIVINCPDDRSSATPELDLNAQLAHFIQTQFNCVWQNQSLSLHTHNSNALLVVDRYSQAPIPKKQGVGLARKIGCDIAVALWKRKLVTAHYIHSSDADTILPDDYFSQTDSITNASAVVYNFTHHCGNDLLGQATALYEASINYYRAGLAWAGSPYAFSTIGSCLAISMQHYCEARGFPKRAGGEDFYLLNKLAKLGQIAFAQGACLCIAARQSDRVPFGTGPAVTKIMALQKLTDFTDYNPKVFAELKTLLTAFNALPKTIEMGSAAVSQWQSQLTPASSTALNELGLAKLLQHLSAQFSNCEQTLKHIHIWFDGFRTLKYIHFLQAHYYPAIPHHQALGLFKEGLLNEGRFDTMRCEFSLPDEPLTKRNHDKHCP